MKKKILLIANSYWYIYNFRRSLIKLLVKKGYEIKIVCPTNETKINFLSKNKIPILNWNLHRRSINPIRELGSIIQLISIYKTEKPDLVHHFTIKACIYGTIAAKFSKTYLVINAITGLGHMFLGAERKHKLMRFIIKPIYKYIFTAKRSKVIFQNVDDQEKLLNMGFIKKTNTKIIRGSGVDINFFKPISDNPDIFDDPIKILFPSRLIKEKGIIETIEACKILLEEGIRLKLIIAGEIDYGNRSCLSKDELQKIKDNKMITIKGFVSNMRSLYADSNIVLLPSWREGLSKTLIEASAMEKPIITTNVPGCRDVIEHGFNGLLVPPKDIEALYLAIKFMINNSNLARKFGKRCRDRVKNNFATKKINNETLRVYQDCFKSPKSYK